MAYHELILDTTSKSSSRYTTTSTSQHHLAENYTHTHTHTHTRTQARECVVDCGDDVGEEIQTTCPLMTHNAQNQSVHIYKRTSSKLDTDKEIPFYI